MKKLLIIGAAALVVIACVLAAGCTSATQTPAVVTEDFVVGTWTTDDGKVIAVFTNDFKGVVNDSGDKVSFTWKKNADDTYELINDSGAVTIMTLEKNKGIMKIPNGDVLTKVLNGTSGANIGTTYNKTGIP
ncbi:MAG TPA: hypothetical protein O0X42_00870 [Methanocorpusculum sp.]|nr:hypothetical protein [Methanocorpusculum sp.]